MNFSALNFLPFNYQWEFIYFFLYKWSIKQLHSQLSWTFMLTFFYFKAFLLLFNALVIWECNFTSQRSPVSQNNSDSCSDDFSLKNIQVSFRRGVQGIMWLMCLRKCLFRTLWGITVFSTRLWGGSRSKQTDEEHVLVKIFSVCVIPPSKRLNQKRVIPFSYSYLGNTYLQCKLKTDVWINARVCDWITEWRGEKFNKLRPKLLFALISLLRQTQGPQEDSSCLKLTFALY